MEGMAAILRKDWHYGSDSDGAAAGATGVISTSRIHQVNAMVASKSRPNAIINKGATG
jgi:hypothetical protein